ncbi:MAG: hypothetical protein K2I76_02610 [Malacoplasma sp.]|nr:hypothetical protein [Malacoplasma sp.]
MKKINKFNIFNLSNNKNSSTIWTIKFFTYMSIIRQYCIINNLILVTGVIFLANK